VVAVTPTSILETGRLAFDELHLFGNPLEGFVLEWWRQGELLGADAAIRDLKMISEGNHDAENFNGALNADAGHAVEDNSNN
jgi:hypothetical protein